MKTKSFVIDVPVNDSEAMDRFQEVMDTYHDQLIEEMQKLAGELNISSSCAADVFYLRTRSRWTPKLEAELIRLHREGNPPNICDFG